MNTIEIRRWDNNEVIFSYTCEDNTLHETVEKAVENGIDLSYADLSNANLSFVNFSYINLKNINLFNADLSYTYLENITYLYANITNAKGINDRCPKKGSFIGWKKCINKNNNTFCIVKLEIPTDAKRSSSTSEKCRCSKAKVLEIQNLDGTKTNIDYAYSLYDIFFKYEVGEIVESDSFDDRYWLECSNGIHFFMNRKDAVNYCE